jgi:ABC-2 type transport system permease protein
VLPLKVLGVTAVTSEYSSGMIRTTFIATPQRLSVMIAKGAVTGGIGVILTTLMVAGMYLVSQTIRGYFDLETASVSSWDTQRFLMVYAIGGLVYVLVPFALGFLLRSTATAITISIVMYFLPGMLGAAMPLWVQENVIRYLPDVALDSLSGSISDDSAVYLGAGLAFLVIAAWIVVSMAIAALMLRYRDA